MSSEQCYSVTEIEREWFYVKLDAKNSLSKAKWSMAWLGGSQRGVTVTEMDERL